MRALVVYESMYGNTHAVACGIAAGLRATHEVTLVPVSAATPELLAEADLLVAGGPTHMHGMSSASSRRMAVQAAAKEGSGLTLDAAARGPGIREWLKSADGGRALAAAFDTRLSGVPAFTGRASRAISRLLKRNGCTIIAAPESFLVSQQNTLLDGEADRARRWGMTVGAASKTYAPAHA
jgi:flavodoxin-like protein